MAVIIPSALKLSLSPKVSAVLTSFERCIDTPTLANIAAVKADAGTLLTSFDAGNVIIKQVTDKDLIIGGPGNGPREQQTALLHLINSPTAALLARFNSVMDDWGRKWGLM